MGQSGVAVVIVSYNTRDKLRRCLSCIEPEHEVIVVDNASADGSVEMVRKEFPAVKLIKNQENVGFGRANNQGCGATARDLILFLNSDAYAAPGSISTLASTMSNPGVVACGGKLLNPDGSLQQSSANELTLWAVFCEQTLLEKALPNSHLFSPYWNTRVLAISDEPKQSEQLMGACLMVRAREGRPIESFDKRYFLYCEDTDLCYRLRRHGQILYVPAARFIHELGSSSTGADRWRSIALYNKGKELYFRIHHGRTQAFVCYLFNRLGALLRLILALITVKPKKAKMFWKVLTCPDPKD